MANTVSEFSNNSQKKISGQRVHLLLGPETGKKQSYTEQIITTAEKFYGDTEVIRVFPYDSNIIDLVATLRTPSLFYNHRVVFLQEIQDLRPGQQLNALVDYCKEPATASTLLLLTENLSRDLPRALTETIRKDCTKIFWQMFENQAQGWISNFFQTRNIQVSEDATNLILELVSANTTILEITCNNLANFFGAKSDVSVTDIEKYIYHSKEETIFSLFDHIAIRNLVGALETVNVLLLSHSSHALQITSALIGQFQRLIRFKELVINGSSTQDALQKLRIFGKQMQRSYLQAHRSYKDVEMEPIYQVIVEFDARIRNLNREMVEPLLQLLLYHIVVRGGRGVWRQFHN